MEKIAVLVGFTVLTIASVVWGLSTPSDTNELGAEVRLRDQVLGFDLIVENTGNRAWRDVRITLDRKYVYTTERIEGGEQVRLQPEDVTYAYHMLRPWGREDWEELIEQDDPGLHPGHSYTPSLVQIRSRQGVLDFEL